MVDGHGPNVETLWVIGLFALAYMAGVFRKVSRHRLDLYDFMMLSTVALVPVAFAYFPGLAAWMAKITGVEFPFVVMFGLLFVAVFIFNHNLIGRVHKLERENRTLIQETSLLRMDIDNRRKKNDAGEGE